MAPASGDPNYPPRWNYCRIPLGKKRSRKLEVFQQKTSKCVRGADPGMADGDREAHTRDAADTVLRNPKFLPYG